MPWSVLSFFITSPMTRRASSLSNDKRIYLGTLPVSVRRNAYGRQRGSFMAEEDVEECRAFPCVFIRAPLIEKVGEGVEVLSRHEGEITAVRWENQLAMTFHPELTEDRRLHEMFLSIIEERGIYVF